MGKATLASVIGGGTVVMLLWLLVIVPEVTNAPEIIEVSDENFGYIQIAENVGDPLSEPIKMVFIWTSKVKETNGNYALMHTKYDYKDLLTEESLWVTEFDEPVNKVTREYLDKPGHFMFPTNLEQKNYEVYDVGGAVMNYNFVGVTEIDGLEVYEFYGETTFDISDVYPDIGHTIYEDYSATNFIEPVTGIEVSFNEKFTDYAIIDGEKVVILDAYDSPTDFSQTIHVQKATSFKSLFNIYYNIIPIIIGVITASIATTLLIQSKVSKSKQEVVELLETGDKKNELVSMINHEIKNPLGVVSNLTDILLMEDEKNPLTDHQRKRIQQIRTTSHQIDDLLSDFADINKIDLNKIHISKTTFDIKKYLENAMESVRPFTGEKNVQLRLRLTDTWTVSADQKRLSQVLSNLVKNSIDFVSESDGEIVVSAKHENSETIISVEDNGVGIPIEESEKIFDSFQQLKTPDHVKHSVTGLGLSVCKGIVEAHGGKIWLDKEFKKGSKFNFSIPDE
ncbi:porin PorA family protein [Nitrosopumilus sp.]|uniref:porin PorA family protein n=1 Tax=Nitrosopumilus sp. TaxID=2024843 RepID=UPI0026104771|nr:porin PorA family protein [Nitrosopumilus sp.]